MRPDAAAITHALERFRDALEEANRVLLEVRDARSFAEPTREEMLQRTAQIAAQLGELEAHAVALRTLVQTADPEVLGAGFAAASLDALAALDTVRSVFDPRKLP